MKMFILLSFISIAVNANMYQCQDADGNIQYTQTPTAECSQEIQTTTGQFVISGVEKSDEESDAESVEDTTDLSSEEIDEKNAEIMQKNCEMSTNGLALLNSEKILTKNGEDGELIIFTQEDRSQEKAKIQQYLDDNCVN